MPYREIKKILLQMGLKITPQRINVFEALSKLNHPSADEIYNYINKNYPSISMASIYNIIETFVEKGLISKVTTEDDTMRYDIIIDRHHHLYSKSDNKIIDYYDEELDRIIGDYFKRKKIENFEIKDFKLQIIGEYINKNK
jgi:Fur family peroxide stress response transcriptional regulator